MLIFGQNSEFCLVQEERVGIETSQIQVIVELSRRPQNGLFVGRRR